MYYVTMISKKKFVVILSVLLVIFAFPVSLVLREIYDFSDAMGIAIPSFIFGVGIGLLISSVFVSGHGRKNNTSDNKDLTSRDENLTSTTIK